MRSNAGNHRDTFFFCTLVHGGPVEVEQNTAQPQCGWTAEVWRVILLNKGQRCMQEQKTSEALVNTKRGDHHKTSKNNTNVILLLMIK